MKLPALDPEQLAALDPAQRAMWTQVYEQQRRKDELIARAVEEGDFDRALAFSESEGRAALLVSLGPGLDDDALFVLLTEWWSTTEAWQGDRMLRAGMMRLLRRVAPVIVDPERTFPGDAELAVYRGNMGEPPGGGSWTLDRAIAERFAAGAFGARARIVFGIEPDPDAVATVWQGAASREQVLGYFDDRGEREVVLAGTPARVRAIAEARRSS